MPNADRSRTPPSEAHLTPEQRDDLRHMVGAQSHINKRDWGFRNHYCAYKGGDAVTSMRELERLGLVVRGHEGVESLFFHCTEAGCKAAGLNAKQTAKALYGN